MGVQAKHSWKRRAKTDRLMWASSASVSTECGRSGRARMSSRTSNGWTCLPDRPDTPGVDPWCVNEPWMNFLDAYINKTEPSYTEMGFAYMMLVQERMASLGNLVAGVAHELNTPLGALTAGHDTVLKAAQKLKATVSEETAQGNGLDAVLDIISDSTKVITTATDRVATIVGSLMSFAGVDQATYQSVDVHAGIESALTLLQSKIGGRIAIEREYGTIDPLYCASAQMNQVFMHVLRNAIEAIDGEGSIKIATLMTDGDIEIRITDTGSGMPPEVVRKIFDFGFRQESRVRMGFGLFLAHKIVDDHGGRIHVESEFGRGT